MIFIAFWQQCCFTKILFTCRIENSGNSTLYRRLKSNIKAALLSSDYTLDGACEPPVSPFYTAISVSCSVLPPSDPYKEGLNPVPSNLPAFPIAPAVHHLTFPQKLYGVCLHKGAHPSKCHHKQLFTAFTHNCVSAYEP